MRPSSATTGKEQQVPSFNAIYMMADSGARGSAQQMRQLAGVRGLMAKPSGAIIETPITSNFREGLSVLQYFISTHGARKGLADTALKTANSGYLTRRLVDVSQDVIIRSRGLRHHRRVWRCGRWSRPARSSSPWASASSAACPSRTCETRSTTRCSSRRATEIDEEKVQIIENAGIEKVMIRSVLTCDTKHGVCVKCYGRDLARGSMVNLGEAVGVIAAQSIGEPGTQLTMRTFHIGGAATRRAEQSHAEAASEGKIRLHNIRFVKDRSRVARS